MRITVDTPDLAGVRRRLGRAGNQTHRIMANALNRTAVTAKKILTQETIKIYHIKSTQVKKAIDIRKSAGSNPFIEIRTNHTGKHKLPLGTFKITPKTAWNPAMSEKPKRKIYKVKIRRDQSAKALVNAFVAKMDNGYTGVFQNPRQEKHQKNPKAYGAAPTVRQKRTQLGLKEYYSLALAQMMSKPEVVQKTIDAAETMLLERLNHEIERVLGGN